MICFPNIKINFGLHVINKREDGFHTIETVFYPVKFCDILEVIKNKTGHKDKKIIFSATGLPVSGNEEDNLIVKAYNLLNADFDLPPVISHLHKIIPMGAGLGGGSGDAAYMITLLNSLLELRLSPYQMEQYAAQLGSDCAFFIKNETAYVSGRGHELEPVPFSLSGYYFVLLYAGFHSNTALAYKRVQCRETPDEHSSLKHLIQMPAEEWRANIKNDFEPSVFNHFPLLAEIKNQLYRSGAVYASMSGSGSAMYGLFKQKPELEASLQKYICFSGPL